MQPVVATHIHASAIGRPGRIGSTSGSAREEASRRPSATPDWRSLSPGRFPARRQLWESRPRLSPSPSAPPRRPAPNIQVSSSIPPSERQEPHLRIPVADGGSRSRTTQSRARQKKWSLRARASAAIATAVPISAHDCTQQNPGKSLSGNEGAKGERVLRGFELNLEGNLCHDFCLSTCNHRF